MTNRSIETPCCTLRLNSRSGDLIGVAWKQPRVELIAEPRLGENFRLLLPLPGYEANYLCSREQRVSRIVEEADGMTCHYDSLRNERGEFKVAVRYEMRAVNGQLAFSIEIENRTDFPLAEVFYGIIGGQHGLGHRLDTESLVPGLHANLAPDVFRNFQGGVYGAGNLGIRYSAQGYLYPGAHGALTMSWLSFYNRKANLGLYYADHDPETRLSALYFEMRPFTKTTVIGDNWPTRAEAGREPVGLTMGWMKFPHTRRGTFRAGNVTLQVHRGDWHEGSRIYRAWFDRHFPVRRAPSWLRREMAWQSIVVSNPEDVVVHRFKDLPRLAAAAKKYGVTTFQIHGWHKGGIDRGYPDYTPDPRLGSAKKFREALRKIKRLGVHPLIFTNIQVADTALAAFQKRWRRFAVNGRWAEDLSLRGYGEGTISSRLGLSRSNMTLLSPAHAAVRDHFVKQFTQLVRDGADGLQIDKLVENGFLDFNPRLPTSPDRSLTDALLATLRDILEAGRAVNPEFALAGETWWDRAAQFVDVGYARLCDVDMQSTALRYTFPEWTWTLAAENPCDHNIFNNGLRYGLVWEIAPRHYNDSMDEPLTRPLSRYLAELIRIRQRHSAVLFHGRFRDTLGATVKGGKHVRYSVFEGMEGNGKACVVVNFGNEPATVEVSWPGGRGQGVEICQPFAANHRAALPVRMRLAPRTCSVVIQ